MSQAIIKKLSVVHPDIPKMYLAVRLGSVYNSKSKAYHIEDPIKEIDNVLNKKGYCYFAKFGKSISENKLNRYLKNNNFHLVIIHKQTGEYTSKTYSIKGFQTEVPESAKSYPSYYKGKENLVGIWFKLEPAEEQIDIDNLRVSSSYQKLRLAMSNSMGSIFFCNAVS